MTSSAFADQSHVPQEAEVVAALGEAASLWSETKARIGAAFSPLAEEWVFSGKAFGWSLRLKRRKRAVCYLTPCEGCFRASFALGEKAVAAATGAGLPEALLAVIEAAPRYAEGRAVRLEVRGADDVQAVVAVARIKMAG